MSVVVEQSHGRVAFWRFWSATTISGAGDAVTAVALPLTALSVLHASAFEVSLVTAANFAAWLLIGLPAGVIVARLPLRGTQITLDLLRAVVLASVPVAAWLHVLTLAQLVVVALVVSIAGVVFAVGNMAFLPSVVPRSQLTARNSLMSASASANQIAGPGLGGLLVQLVGGVSALLFDVVSYLVSALLLSALPRPARAERQGRVPVRRQIAEGWRFVSRHPVMAPCLADATLVNFVCAGLLALTPVYLVRTLHASPFVVGVLLATEGVGALVGASLTPRLIRGLGSARACVVSALAGGLLALTMPLAHGTLGMVLFGVGNAGFAAGTVVQSIAFMTHRQTEAPPELLTRVLATTRSVSWSVTPFGALLAGAVASTTSPRTALWGLVALTVLCPVILWASPVRGRRDLSDPTPEG